MPEYIIKSTKPEDVGKVEVELVDTNCGFVALKANGIVILELSPSGKIYRFEELSPSLGFRLDYRGRVDIV